MAAERIRWRSAPIGSAARHLDLLRLDDDAGLPLLLQQPAGRRASFWDIPIMVALNKVRLRSRSVAMLAKAPRSSSGARCMAFAMAVRACAAA